jgi:hypothetical protein
VVCFLNGATYSVLIVVMTNWRNMTLISRADFARLAGVSRAAITQAAKRESIALEVDGTINAALPINAKWLSDKRAGKKHVDTPAQAKARKSAREMVAQSDTVAPPTPEPEVEKKENFDDVLTNTIEASAEKLKFTRARRINAEADTRLKDLRAAREKSLLIPRDLVRRKFSAFDAALKTNFRDMPRRIAAQVYALALANGAREVEAYLEKEISSAISRAVTEASRQELI